ncbi:MAG: hypothetical protein Q8K65_05135 [Alphaproteobacteria bacterium]|nr:hypothetical protein [Alphaproteobacteria bacterium]
MSVQTQANAPAAAKLVDTSGGTSRYLAEGLQQLAPENYPEKNLVQRVKDYLVWDAKATLHNAKIRLQQTEITMENPLALASAVPLVERLRINRALETISKVPEGKVLVDLLKQSGVPVKMEKQFGSVGASFSSRKRSQDGKLNIDPGQIFLPAFSNHGRLVAHLTHELRHLEQAVGNVLDPTVTKAVSPLESIWYNRVIEADASATATDIAYKLHKAGHSDSWKELQRDRSGPTNIAAAYEAAVQKNPQAVEDGTAKRAAYDGWFEARGALNREFAEIYNSQGFANYSSVGGALQKGYLDKTPIQPLDPQDIKKVGALSGTGVNYLDLAGARPVDDAHYRRNTFNKYEAEWVAREHVAYQSKFSERNNPERKSALESTQGLIKFSNDQRGLSVMSPKIAGAAPPAAKTGAPATTKMKI